MTTESSEGLVAQASPSWLAPRPVIERVELDARSWVDIARGFVPAADEVHRELESAVSWQAGKVFRYERWIEEPRLSSWQKGGSRHPSLAEAEEWISERYRVRFDGVALALYRHERDSVAFHRDREMKWLEDTVIGVLTFGAQRPWLMKPATGDRRDDDTTGALDLAPASGDLLVMGGRCQVDWLHAVPKVQGRVRSRISAQWRWTSRRGRPDTAPSYYAPRRFGSGGRRG
jgi:alkylated DNA repair dioxygenase AlkB